MTTIRYIGPTGLDAIRTASMALYDKHNVEREEAETDALLFEHAAIMVLATLEQLDPNITKIPEDDLERRVGRMVMGLVSKGNENEMR